MMTAPTVHQQMVNSSRQTLDSIIPDSVLIIGKKRASEYLAPALFRIHNTGGLEIRARGSLSISTAVDVAELVKRNVVRLAVRSISVGTDEVVIDGSIRRMSTIEIALSKDQEPAIVANLPMAEVAVEFEQPAVQYAAEQVAEAATVTATAFVEQDPAAVIDRLLLAKEAAPAKKKKAVRASTVKKTRKKKAKTD